MVRPDRLERPTFWFVARRSIQLSYGRIFNTLPGKPGKVCREREVYKLLLYYRPGAPNGQFWNFFRRSWAGELGGPVAGTLDSAASIKKPLRPC